MKIGQLARAVGCHAQSIRHYESLGLLPPSQRTPTGHRRYGQEDLARLLQVRRARRLGLSLLQIRALLESETAHEALREPDQD
ncbi:MerR family transcriptional regulator [Stenotrophomonas sp. HITSZ_GD]|uniref:MerR family transcriptional regulator n=1 Tax=Stenotrophomonas sp. HITSZ_GD TaxID=3037248 RepID=UPI00240D1994|nr:MerR family transcriptional regulator [Stenotrophomonas sp. HITSZ_GD]MDG2523867.1 MerR family transcriptional regulator [Stenotrophomonas sp. HITSZ_GD]